MAVRQGVRPTVVHVVGVAMVPVVGLSSLNRLRGAAYITAGRRNVGSRLLDQVYHDALLQRDLDTPIVFQCHHGVRSQQAAEYFRRKGFRNLSNLQGGIDAWSLLVDPTVPRY